MQNTFDFVCNLSAIKETEKFKPYEHRTFDSGWQNRSLKFNAIAGANRIMLEIRGGCFVDGHNKVYTFKSVEKDGKRSVEKMEVNWRDRLDPNIVSQVASFRKFIVDLAEPGLRPKLMRIKNEFNEGTITDETIEFMNGLGIYSEDELNEKLDKVNKKRYEFISEWDFAEAVNKLIHNDKIKNTKFVVRGNVEIDENTDKDGNRNFYTHYIPTSIRIASDDKEIKSKATFDLFFGRGAVDDNDFDKNGTYHVNAYTFNYDSRRKRQIACPVMVDICTGINEKRDKIAAILKRNFTVSRNDKPYKELGVIVDVIDGAEVVPLTADTLSDNEREMLELGVMTMEEIQKERGSVSYGDRVRKYVVDGFAKGWMQSGSKDTAYTDDDMSIPVLPDPKKNIDDIVGDDDDEDDDDLDIEI